MSFAEIFSFINILIKYWNAKRHHRSFKIVPSGFKWVKCCYFAIPAICDIIATMCGNYGKLYCDISIYSIVKSISNLFVAAFSFIFVLYREKFDLPQLLG